MVLTNHKKFRECIKLKSAKFNYLPHMDFNFYHSVLINNINFYTSDCRNSVIYKFSNLGVANIYRSHTEIFNVNFYSNINDSYFKRVSIHQYCKITLLNSRFDKMVFTYLM